MGRPRNFLSSRNFLDGHNLVIRNFLKLLYGSYDSLAEGLRHREGSIQCHISHQRQHDIATGDPYREAIKIKGSFFWENR